MKRFFSVLLLVCMVISLLPLSAFADEPTVEEALPAAAEAPVEEAVPEVTEAPEVTEIPESTEAPAEEAAPVVTEAPAEEAAPVVTEAPAEEPAATETPEATEAPAPTETPAPTATPAEEEYGVSLLSDGEAATDSGTYYLTVRGESCKVNGEAYESWQSIEITADSTVEIVMDVQDGYKAVATYSNLDDYLAVTAGDDAGQLSFVMPAYDVSITASTVPSNYRATIEHTEKGVSVSYGDPDAPVYFSNAMLDHDGLVLVGWTVGSENGTLLPLYTYHFFEEDTHLYAKMEQGVKLTYHFASGNMTEYVAKGQKTPLILPDTESEGRCAIALSTGPDGTGEIITETEEGLFHVFNADTELYPVYGEPITVTFDMGDGQTWTKTGAKGCPVRLDKDGLVDPSIKYWEDRVGQKQYVPGDSVAFQEDVTLYAETTTDTVTLTLHANGGRTYGGVPEDQTYDQTVPRGSKTMLSECGMYSAPTGMEFRGWSLTADGEPITEPAIFSEDTDLYAIWGKVVLITYDPNGGSGGTQYQGVAGNCAKNYTSVVTREGYTLAGWSTDKAGATLFDFTKPVTANTTLYAVWEKITNEKTDESTGVTVEVPEGEESGITGLVFVAAPLPKDDETVVVTVIGKKMTGTVEKSFVLDIYFAEAETGDEVAVSGQRTVTIPIPEGWDTKKTVVLYVDPESENVVNMNGVVSADGRTISFVTDHFSYYALVQVAEAESGEKAFVLNSDTSYATLPEAVAAAEDGAVIRLCADAQGAGAVIDKSITIDFAGHTYTIVGEKGNGLVGSSGTETNGLQILRDRRVTLKNGTLNIGSTVTDCAMLIQNYADLMITDMTLDGTGTSRDGTKVFYVLSNNFGNVSIGGNTSITAPAGKVAFDVYDYASGGYEPAPVVNVATSGVITGAIEVSDTATLNISGGTFTAELKRAWCASGFAPKANADGTYTVSVVPNGEAAIGDAVYETLAEALEAAQSGQNINLRGNVAAAPAAGSIAKSVYIVNFGGYTIAGLDAETAVRAALADGYRLESSFDGAVLFVSEKSESDAVAARVGEKEYATVQEALLAANAGDKVTLVENADEADSYLHISSGVTLDLNGKSLTAAGLIAFNGAKVRDSGASNSKTDASAQGWLVIPQGHLKLDKGNTQVPIWVDGSGYAMLNVSIKTPNNQSISSQTSDGFIFSARPGFGYLNTNSVRSMYFADNGGQDHGLSMTVKVEWQGTNETIHQEYVYKDSYFKEVYADNNSAFGLTMSGLGSIDEVTITVVVVSDTGVEFSGESVTYTKN